ncbi:MAG TPA: dihydropteroate synthase, partial [Candidatus Aminicenantes bacterium]|nr:dihydropteroate synthase [Candidatus Aminicenantes bacterium]
MKRKITRLTLRNNSYLLGERTWLMGILNVTPDSFSDGGRFLSPERAIEHGLQMVEQGADIIDIGGESSRPGSNPVTAEEEVERILPVIKGLRKQTNCFLSVDTTKAYVAQQALDEGVDIINDISAGRFDPEILPLAKKYRATVILMH